MAQAANVTKFLSGGSGNNYIPDGYIKSIEKVWFDTYTIAFTNTNTTVDFAVLPMSNKKIMGIEVAIFTSISQSNGTLSIGFNTDANIDAFLPATTISHNATYSGIVLPTIGFIQAYTSATTTNATNVIQTPMRQAAYQLITAGTQTTISLKLNNWTMTTGTIYTIVRYT
jgi:hypothetical protein